MWVISRLIADVIIGQNYAENSLYNPVEVNGVFIISEVEKNALILQGYTEGDFELLEVEL